MRSYTFLFGAIAVLGIASLQSRAAGKAAPRKAPQANPTEKVWTNADLDALRDQDLISLVGPYPEEAALAPEATSEAAPYERTQDPLWYAGQAAQLRTEIELTEAGLRTSQERLAEAQNRDTQPGVNLVRGNVGVTPQEGIALLEERARAVQAQLDDLADLARRNDIPPGALR